MQQNTVQINRSSRRIGSTAFIASVVIVIISTMFYRSREDPAKHPLVFMEYANSNSWVAVHMDNSSLSFTDIPIIFYLLLS